MVFVSLYSLIGAGFAFLGLLASATASPIARHKTSSSSSSTLVALQFANVLEQLESTFYAQALKKFTSADFMAAGFSSSTAAIQQLTTIAGDESTHASTLKSAIMAMGGKTIPGCSFNVASLLTDVPTMVAAARLVENVGVSAYLGALTLIKDEAIRTAAATIMTIEARHQTILNLLAGATTIPQAFDVALNPSEILALTGGLISNCSLGIPANVPLQVNSSGPLKAGTKLNFTSAALTANVQKNEKLYCQFLIGGAAVATVQPIDQCSVPANFTGPGYVLVTNSSQPLANNIRDAATGTIVAGPQLLFVDNQMDLLAGLVRSGTNSTVATQNNATTTNLTTPTTVALTGAPKSSGVVNLSMMASAPPAPVPSGMSASHPASVPSGMSASRPASAPGGMSSSRPSPVPSGMGVYTTTITPSQASAIIAGAMSSAT